MCRLSNLQPACHGRVQLHQLNLSRGLILSVTEQCMPLHRCLVIGHPNAHSYSMQAIYMRTRTKTNAAPCNFQSKCRNGWCHQSLKSYGHYERFQRLMTWAWCQCPCPKCLCLLATPCLCTHCHEYT